METTLRPSFHHCLGRRFAAVQANCALTHPTAPVSGLRASKNAFGSAECTFKNAKLAVGAARKLDGRRTLVQTHATLPTWALAKAVDSRESPFRELELMELWDGTGKTRVRQHVNPLRLDFQRPTVSPDWAAVFTDPSLPLALDIGSGYGRFLMLLQRTNPDQRVNYLGLEIRRPLVERSNEWAVRLGLKGRLHYVFANATVSLRTVLAGYRGPLIDVFIQFPDPHFKKRHHKRRVVQPQMVEALADLMPSGARLLLQSDVEEVAVAMRNMFERYGREAFELAPQHREGPVFFSRPTVHPAPGYAAGVTSSVDHLGSSTGSPGDGDKAASREAVIEAGGHLTCAPLGPSSPGTITAVSGHAHDANTGYSTTTSWSISGSGSGSSSYSSRGPASDTGLEVNAQDTTGSSCSSSSSGTDSGAEDEVEEGGRGGHGGGSRAGSDDDSDGDIADMVSQWAAGGWLLHNPLGTPTEREHYVAQLGLPVYRVALVRG